MSVENTIATGDLASLASRQEWASKKLLAAIETSKELVEFPMKTFDPNPGPYCARNCYRNLFGKAPTLKRDWQKSIAEKNAMNFIDEQFMWYDNMQKMGGVGYMPIPILHEHPMSGKHIPAEAMFNATSQGFPSFKPVVVPYLATIITEKNMYHRVVILDPMHPDVGMATCIIGDPAQRFWFRGWPKDYPVIGLDLLCNRDGGVWMFEYDMLDAILNDKPRLIEPQQKEDRKTRRKKATTQRKTSAKQTKKTSDSPSQG